jgi:hypothetical protein
VPPYDLGRIDWGPVKAHSGATPAIGPGYVDLAIRARPERPEVHGGGVARHRARTAGENSAHLPVELERGRVAHAIHAPVNAVQISAVDSSLKRSVAHARREGLRPRDVPPLALGE